MKPKELFIIYKTTEYVEDDEVAEVMVEDILWFLDEGQANEKRDELEAKYHPQQDEDVTYTVEKKKFSDKES